MLTIFIRTSIIFLTLTVIMRLMGKRQIGEMQPFEFIITLIVADLACIPMADVSIPLVYGIIAILALFVWHNLVFIIEKTSATAKRIISGKPSIIINKDGVDITELKKNNIDIEDLLQSLRSQGYFTFEDVDYAIFESNGKFSALQSQQSNNSNISVPLVVVEDGKLRTNVLNRKNISREIIDSFLKEQQTKLKDVEILTLDSFGKIYFKKRKNKYGIYNITLPESVEKW